MYKNSIFLLLITVIFACNKPEKNTNKATPSSREERSQIISSEEINKKIQNGEALFYQNVVISGDINFTESKNKSFETQSVTAAYINQSVFFKNCNFQGKIIASSQQDQKYTFCCFRKSVNFNNCTFQGKIDFRESQFDRLASFHHNKFQDTVLFEGAFFNFKNIFFNNNTFLAQTKFNRAIFSGITSFIKSDFHDHAHFQNVYFQNEVNFGALTIRKKSDFSMINCHGVINFSNSYFYAACNMEDSRFFDKALLSDIKAEHKINLDNSIFYYMPKKSTLPDTSIIFYGNARFIKNLNYNSLK